MTKDLLQNIKPAEPFEVDPTPFWSQYIPQVIFTTFFYRPCINEYTYALVILVPVCIQFPALYDRNCKILNNISMNSERRDPSRFSRKNPTQFKFQKPVYLRMKINK